MKVEKKVTEGELNFSRWFDKLIYKYNYKLIWKDENLKITLFKEKGTWSKFSQYSYKVGLNKNLWIFALQTAYVSSDIDSKAAGSENMSKDLHWRKKRPPGFRYSMRRNLRTSLPKIFNYTNFYVLSLICRHGVSISKISVGGFDIFLIIIFSIFFIPVVSPLRYSIKNVISKFNKEISRQKFMQRKKKIIFVFFRPRFHLWGMI